MLIREERQGKLYGIKIARNTTAVSHLMYADDTLLLCRASTQEAEVLKQCLNRYCAWSGQLLNCQKSAILFSRNVDFSTQFEIRELLQMAEMDRSARYLGNPLILSKNHYNDFHFLKERLLKRIERWKTKFLSRAGRTTLIQVVTSAVPLYTLSTFVIPTRLSREMDALNR